VTVELSRIAPTLGFTLEDLALNRAGKLSAHQSWEAIKSALTMSGLTVMVIGAFLAVVFVVRPTGFARLAYYALSLTGVALFAFLGWRSVAGAVKKVVLHAEGTLDLHGSGKGTVAVIGRARVPISFKAFEVLTKGGHYRMFYLSDANNLLSIEPIGGEGDSHGADAAGAGDAGQPVPR
jgi:hypothetical protein